MWARRYLSVWTCPTRKFWRKEFYPEFSASDLSSLPKLDELTGSTDITAFLRKGVPEHLRNEALRKSWALDPAIRNYVNPALEYAYDWNTPGGVPGGGELSAGLDIARMVSQIMGDVGLQMETHFKQRRRRRKRPARRRTPPNHRLMLTQCKKQSRNSRFQRSGWATRRFRTLPTAAL